MNRDDMIRQLQANRGTWPALVGIYAVILGTMVLSAMAIT